MRTSARSGQHARARWTRRGCSEFFVESGIFFGIASSSPPLGVAPPAVTPAAGQTAMAMCSPYRVVLTEDDRRVLTARARSQRAAHRVVLRARIVLAPPTGWRTWRSPGGWASAATPCANGRARFCAEGLAGLADRAR